MPKLTQNYNFEACYPKLTAEWHPTKNGSCKPADFAPKSSYRAYWQCTKGHVWQTAIHNRANGTMCPCCAGKEATPETSLQALYPEIASQWHSSRNNQKHPEDVLPFSNQRVWWQCEFGHEWQSRVCDRVKGNGCPCCAGKEATPGTSLQALYPEIACLWHPFRNNQKHPENVLPFSNQKVWWQCEFGHEWQSSICSHTKSMKPACKQCNSLAFLFPEIAAQWHPEKNGSLLPQNIAAKSGKKVWWRCPSSEDHEWQASISSRTGGRAGCPCCRNRKPSMENSLSIHFPGISAQWHPTLNGNAGPQDFSSTSSFKAWWICSHGHDWQTTISHRTQRGHCCPKCSNQTSRMEIRVFTEMQSIFSDAIWRHKINGVEIDVFLPSILMAIEFDGYPWHESFEKRDKEKNCYLSQRGIKIIRIRDERLSTPKIGDSDIVLCANGLRASLNSVVSHIAEIQPEYSNDCTSYLRNKGWAAHKEYQSLLSLLPGPPQDKSLIHTHPAIAEEWDDNKNSPLTPRQFSYGSGKKVFWKCNKGHSWSASINSRTNMGSGCPKCSNKSACPDNSLASLYPEIALELHPERNNGMRAEDVVAGSGKKLWWRCNKGHEWEAQVVLRTKREIKNCPICKK